MIFVFEIFSDFLCSQSKIFYFVTFAYGASGWYLILCLANMAEAYGISRYEFMIADAD